MAAHDDGLQEPLCLQGTGEFLQSLGIEMLPWLIGIGVHLRHREMQQFGIANRVCAFQEGS